MEPTDRVSPAMPTAVRVYVALVVLELIARALLPPPELTSVIASGCHVLIVVGLLHRSDVARIAALLLGVFAVLGNLPRLLAIPLLMATTSVIDAAILVLIDAALNFAVGTFVLLSFNGPQARRWTASAPPPPPIRRVPRPPVHDPT